MLPFLPALALEAAQPKLAYPTRPHIIRPTEQERAAFDPALAMMPIAALQMRNAGSSSSGDTLADLWGGSDKGDWWRGDDVYTDGNAAADFVTTATGVANGLISTLGDATKKPQLEAGGVSFGLRFNGGAGNNQRLLYNFGVDVPQPGVLMLCASSGDTNTHVMMTGSSSTKRWQMSNDSGDNIVGFAGGTGPLDSSINSPLGATAKVLTLVVNGASSRWRVNGTQTASGNLGTAVTNQVLVGSFADGSFSVNMLLFAWLFWAGSTVLSDTKIDRAERLFGSFAGVTW